MRGARPASQVSKRWVYYLAIIPFVAFFAAFAFLVYPHSNALHFHGLYSAVRAPFVADLQRTESPCPCWLCARPRAGELPCRAAHDAARAWAAGAELCAQVAPAIPTGLHGAIRVVENWTFSLFFGAAELWGSVIIAVLFWTLANDVCSVQEAKSVYPIISASANVALVAAGSYMKMMNEHVLKHASTQTFLQCMVTTIVAGSVIMATVCARGLQSAAISGLQGASAHPSAVSADVIRSSQAARGPARKHASAAARPLFALCDGHTSAQRQCGRLQAKFYIDRRVLNDKSDAGKSQSGRKKKKVKGTFRSSLATLRESPKIMNLALLVVCYALAHRVFEFAWKGQLRALFPTTQAYSGALAEVSIYTGARRCCRLVQTGGPRAGCCFASTSSVCLAASHAPHCMFSLLAPLATHPPPTGRSLVCVL